LLSDSFALRSFPIYPNAISSYLLKVDLFLSLETAFGYNMLNVIFGA